MVVGDGVEDRRHDRDRDRGADVTGHVRDAGCLSDVVRGHGRNRVLVGATLAILIVAGTINALMYVLSLYFQNPAAFGMNALEAGLATLPAAAGMIAVTPLITPLAGRIGGGAAVALGFALAAAGFAVLAFVEASWTYGAFVVPLVALAVGLGVANGRLTSGHSPCARPAGTARSPRPWSRSSRASRPRPSPSRCPC